MGGLLFHKGDRVVYPHHGAAIVEDLVKLEMFGKQRTYIKLRLPHGSLTLMVPVDSTEKVGLRGVVSREEVDKVFDLIREDGGLMPILWSQRYKVNLAKLISGDIYQGAEVVRDLSLRENGNGLSGAEKRMLTKARQILISELTLAVGSTEENAEAMLDEVLAESR
ncbi:MAG: CarD family transcriptional regulator [Actinomycetota bacterium]